MGNKIKSSKYSVDDGRVRIQRDVNRRTSEIPEGVDAIMRDKNNGMQHLVPLKNKNGKPLSNAQYVRLLAEHGHEAKGVDKGLIEYCKGLINSGKSEHELNNEFATFLKSMFVKST